MHKTNYTVNNETKTMVCERAFDAPLPLVWQAWTERTILDQWWAPKPWKAETKSMDFTPGGKWLYSMVSPQGEKHWSIFEYGEVVPQKYYTHQNHFCDENGKYEASAPSSHWRVEFTSVGETTNVTTTLTFDTAETMEMFVNRGFKGGFAMGHENLDAYLQAHFK